MKPKENPEETRQSRKRLKWGFFNYLLDFFWIFEVFWITYKWSHKTAVKIWAKTEHRAKSYARFTEGISSYGFPRAQLQIAGLKTRKPKSQAKAPLSSSHPMDSRLVRATRIHNQLWYQLKDRNGEPERGGGVNGSRYKNFLKRTRPISQSQLRVTHKQEEAHTNLSWYLMNKAWKARKQGGSKHERTWAINEEGWDLPGQPTQVTGSPWALQSRTGSPGHKWPDQPTPFGSPGTSDRITRDSPENCPRNRPKL
jgi:hypothetical protein